MDRLTSPLRRTAAAAVLGLLLCSALSLAQAPAGKIMVEDVIPQGYHAVPPQKILSLVKTRAGAEYLQETVNEDVKRLYESKLFANVRVQLQRTGDNKVKVYFLVAEYPSMVQDVIYQGAKHLKPDELETITGIRKGAPLNPIANKMAVQAILHRYNDMGRMFAGVELLEGDKPGDTRVVFNITEGPVVKVSSIDFTGNTFVHAARLRVQVDSSSQFLGIFGGTYEPMRADHDVAKLEEYYRTFGYHDVHVSRDLVWDPDFRHLHLVYHIQEGPRYRVASVQVDGNKIFSSDELLERGKLHEGDFYNKGAAEVDQRLIQDKYGYYGYNASVKEADFTPGPGLVAVHYEVQERPPARVAGVTIVGNTTTRDNVILRQIPVYPGQILSYPDLRVAEKNLARLGIFEMDPSKGGPPHVSVLDPESESPFKQILINVQEMPTGSLIFGVGVNSDAGLVGSIVLNERNFDITNWPTSLDQLFSGQAFRGAGQELRLEAVPGTQVQRYSATFREPYLFDSLFGLTSSVYYYDRFYNEYEESRLGTRLTLSRRLSPNWTVSGTVTIEEVAIHSVSIFAPEEFQAAVGDHFLAGFRAGITRDTRDSYIRPTEGSIVEFAGEEVTGDYTFPRLTADGTKFWTIYQRPDGSGRQVLAAHSRLGWAGSHTPFFERFYAGGFASMRGFEFRGMGPNVMGFETGGDFEFLNSLEYQIPILANDHLWAVLFCDTGTVEPRIEIKDYRVAVGAGLRIQVPMLGPVPIALDLGFPIVKGPNDHEQVFSFWVGFFH
jgi:outer membrane protein assembly complex protein YaeT